MYEIVWSPKAKISLFRILEFTTKHHQSNTYAIKIVREIQRIERLLLKSPFIGSRVVEFTSEKIYRFILLKNYSLMYRVVGNSRIEIVYFWDNRQNPELLRSALQ